MSAGDHVPAVDELRAERRVRGVHLAALAALLAFAGSLLSIGLTRDWRLLHEDNGAMHTTFALAHLRLGLARTRAHDLFFEPSTGRSFHYGHHPPATALLLAGLFAVTGSDAPWTARMLPIAAHLSSLVLMVRLLGRLLPLSIALLGGLLMATLPMSAYFGRMVNYEPLCLAAVLLQLNAYAAWAQGRSRRALAMLGASAVLGGLIDWASLFFTAAIAAAQGLEYRTGGPRALARAAPVATAGLAVLAVDVWHLWFAAHGSLLALSIVSGHWLEQSRASFASFLWSQFQVLRRYETHTGLVAVVVVAAGLTAPRSALAFRLFRASDPRLLRRLLAISGAAAAAYLLAAPAWAQAHAYWQFYGLPFVVLSMVLVGRALWSAAGRRAWIARAALALALAEVAVSSAAMLHFRHTAASRYAVQETARMRSTYLAPRRQPPNAP